MSLRKTERIGLARSCVAAAKWRKGNLRKLATASAALESFRLCRQDETFFGTALEGRGTIRTMLGVCRSSLKFS